MIKEKLFKNVSILDKIYYESLKNPDEVRFNSKELEAIRKLVRFYQEDVNN